MKVAKNFSELIGGTPMLELCKIEEELGLEAKIFAKGGASSIDVYATLVIGANAYGVTEITGGGLQHIVKQLGSGGSADPLNQRATVGWKATKTAVVLSPQYMVRIETTSSYN